MHQPPCPLCAPISNQNEPNKSTSANPYEAAYFTLLATQTEGVKAKILAAKVIISNGGDDKDPEVRQFARDVIELAENPPPSPKKNQPKKPKLDLK